MTKVGFDELSHEREFLVAALQRSGHHAIINWIIKQCKVPYCFLNHVDPGSNPWETYRSDSTFLGIDEPHDINFFHPMKLNCIIFNYEDRCLNDIYQKNFIDQRDTWLGQSQCRRDLLILRDPYNFFASRLKWSYGNKYPGGSHNLTSPVMRVKLVSLWKEYAKAFLDKKYKNNELIPINYNQWFENVDYRRSIAMSLNLNFTDSGLEEVARWGPNLWRGNSFDDLKYDGRAQQMDVLNRWKIFLDDNLYLSLFQDKEILNMSNEIFGKIECAEVIFQKSLRLKTRAFLFFSKLRKKLF